MSDDSWPDEDWYDDEPELHDEESLSCPECGQAMHTDAAMCPSCGYWLTEEDQRQLDPGKWSILVRIVAAALLIAFLLSILMWI